MGVQKRAAGCYIHQDFWQMSPPTKSTNESVTGIRGLRMVCACGERGGGGIFDVCAGARCVYRLGTDRMERRGPAKEWT